MFAAHTFRRATQENEKKTANCDGRTEENRINGNFYYNEKPCDIDDRGDFIDRRAGFVLSATSDGSNSFTSSMQPKASLQDLKSFLDIPFGIRFACLFAIFPLLRFHTLTSSPSHPRPSPPNAQKRAKVEDVLPNPNTESFAGMANDPDLIALGSMAAMPNFHHHPNFSLAYGGGLVQPMMQHMSFRRGGGSRTTTAAAVITCTVTAPRSPPCTTRPRTAARRARRATTKTARARSDVGERGQCQG
jgi:hypothetical protein